ncbi:unnamed protein product [Nyctereutes procyonoides]|uniref:(raccoon dog) hypothetical protein n=1 Tax=Nyctereutes procyonoides TaxID=34880 RepID=A0A811YZQ2_NYCPR|nr:unnamed protein product [Nyctereutes procyonoides]
MSYSHSSSNVEGLIILKVNNLTYHTSANILWQVFEKYGCIGNVYIPQGCFH